MAHNSSESATSTIPLPELIVSLDQATIMARQLPTTSDPALVLQIYNTLHHAHHSLSTFLSVPQLASLPPAPLSAAENSLSSASDAANNVAEPMQVGEDDGNGGRGKEGPEENSRNSAIDRVEERMRNCFIKNKRPKRRLSPSAAEDRAWRDDGGGVGGDMSFDPLATRMRALDLVYQFHG